MRSRPPASWSVSSTSYQPSGSDRSASSSAASVWVMAAWASRNDRHTARRSGSGRLMVGMVGRGEGRRSAPEYQPAALPTGGYRGRDPSPPHRYIRSRSARRIVVLPSERVLEHVVDGVGEMERHLVAHPLRD